MVVRELPLKKYKSLNDGLTLRDVLMTILVVLGISIIPTVVFVLSSATSLPLKYNYTSSSSILKEDNNTQALLSKIKLLEMEKEQYLCDIQDLKRERRSLANKLQNAYDELYILNNKLYPSVVTAFVLGGLTWNLFLWFDETGKVMFKTIIYSLRQYIKNT